MKENLVEDNNLIEDNNLVEENKIVEDNNLVEDNEDNNLVEDNNSIEDNNNNERNSKIKPNNINNASLLEHMNDIPLKEGKSPELMLRKTIRHMNKTNKLHRYKIGLIFYIIYISTYLVELITLIIFKYDLDFEPFCETYLRYSAFTVFLFLTPFLNRTNSSKLYDIINITKYYIPDWKKKKREFIVGFLRVRGH